MKEIQIIKSYRIKLILEEFIETLLFEFFPYSMVSHYFNFEDDSVIYINHVEQTIRLRVYLLPSCIHGLKRYEMIKILHDIIQYRHYKVKIQNVKRN